MSCGGTCLSWHAANRRETKASLLKDKDCAMVEEEGVTLAGGVLDCGGWPITPASSPGFRQKGAKLGFGE